jgi:catechol 2,3-dioxygenase-like lactoylglutathione lyase family enzyme
MGYHHLALATRDIKATHEFYTAAMGFELVKVAVGPAGKRGFAKHLFYDTGNGELIAFWDLHDPDLAPDWVARDRDRSRPAALDRTTSRSTPTTGPRSIAAATAGSRTRRRDGSGSRLVPVDLRDRPERDPGRVLHHHRPDFADRAEAERCWRIRRRRSIRSGHAHLPRRGLSPVVVVAVS